MIAALRSAAVFRICNGCDSFRQSDRGRCGFAEVVITMTRLQIRPGLAVRQDDLAAFCRRHQIVWLAVFGSVLRDDFGPGSDIDVIVEFAPGQTPSLFGMLDLEAELSSLLTGRPIDLGTKRALNRWIKDRVLSEARVLYDAA